MKLTDIIEPTRIVPELHAADRDSVLHELVRRGFLDAGQTQGLHLEDEERVVQILNEREALGSTGIKDGLAIPHGKVPGLTNLSACIGIHRGGIDFGALDGHPSRVFIVLISPESCRGDHLKALARISRLFSGSNLMRRLLECETPEQIYEELSAEDARL